MKNILSKKIVISIVTAIVLFSIAGFGIVYFLGLTKDSARDKLLRDNVDLSDFGQFREGFNKNSKKDLITRSGLDNEYFFAGLAAGLDFSYFQKHLDKNINLSRELISISTIHKDSTKQVYDSSCETFLGYLVSLNNDQITNHALKNGNLGSSQNCALEYAIKKKFKNQIALLSQNGIIVKDEVKKILIDNCYPGLAYTNLVESFNDVIACNDKELMSLMANKLSNDDKNSFLKYSIEKNYPNAMDALIANGADIKSLNLNDTQLADYAFKLKSDGLLSFMITKKYKLPDKIKYTLNNSEFEHDPFVFAIQNNLKSSAMLLLENGYNPTVRYKPSQGAENDYPVLFALYGNKSVKLVEDLSAKYGLFDNLTNDEKRKLLAFSLEVFETGPDDDSLKLVEMAQKVYSNVNDGYIYIGSDAYQSTSYPMWAYPFIKNLKMYTVEQVKTRKPYYEKYFNNLKKYTLNTNFVFEDKKPMYLALLNRTNNFVKYLVENSNVSPQDPIRVEKDKDAISTSIEIDSSDSFDFLITKTKEINKINNDQTYITSVLNSDHDNKNYYIEKLIANGADPKKCNKFNECPKNLAIGKNIENKIFEKF
ncbi:MAG: hypothetical protein ACRCXZ_01990 [Patescibacteria group bacterium]